MDIDKICEAAKMIIQTCENLELTKEELSQAGNLASAEMTERYITELREHMPPPPPQAPEP